MRQFCASRSSFSIEMERHLTRILCSDLDKIEVAEKEEKLIQPNFIADIPIIGMESDYDKITDPKPSGLGNNEKPTVAQQMTKAMKDDAHVKARGVNIGTSGASVIEIDNDGDKSDEGVPPSVKQEPIVVEDVTEDDLKGEDDVIPPLCTPQKSKRNKTPRREHVPTMKGQHYAEGVHGV